MSSDAENIRAACIAKSDQLNADDLIGAPMTGHIRRVKTTRAKRKGDQPVSIWLTCHEQPWKPCKTMVRLLRAMWGDEPAEWIGHAVTLYNEPSVKWSNDEVGGVRVSHMSGIDGVQNVTLTETRGRKRTWTVRPCETGPIVLDAVLEGHGYTVAQLAEARAAKGRPALGELSDAQRRFLAVRYIDAGALRSDIGG